MLAKPLRSSGVSCSLYRLFSTVYSSVKHWSVVCDALSFSPLKYACAGLPSGWEVLLQEHFHRACHFASLLPAALILPCLLPTGEAALRGEPRMQSLPVSSALTNHRTGPPPISPNKRKLSMDQGDEELDCENDHVSKMSRMFNPHL